MARTKALLEAKKRAMGLAPPEQSVSSGSTQVPLSSAAPPSATLTPEEQAMRKAELIKARLQGSTLLRNVRLVVSPFAYLLYLHYPMYTPE
jgi:hypothetical protein